jgi:hypothetical protein
MKADQLIEELLKNPAEFAEQDRSDLLVEAFLSGEIVEDDLRRLLSSKDPAVLGEAAYVVAELGSRGCELIDEMVPLSAHADAYVAFWAIELVGICRGGEEFRYIAVVFDSLRHHDRRIRTLGMKLLGNYSREDLSRIRNHLLKRGQPVRDGDVSGLASLIDGDRRTACELMASSNSVQRLYGAILARRLIDSDPSVLASAQGLADEDVRAFAEETLWVYRG